MSTHERMSDGADIAAKPPVASASAVVAVMIVHAISLRFAPAIPSHRLLFLFFFFTLVLVPGYLISRWIFRGTHGAFRALLAFLCGTALFYALLTLFAALRLEIMRLGTIIPLIAVAIALAQARKPLPPPGEGADITPSPPARIAERALLLAMLVLAAILVLRADGYFPYTSDSPDHVAYVRTIARTGEAFPEQFLYRDGGSLTHDVRKGLVHAMWGTIEALTGRSDGAAIWPLVSLIGSVFVILSLSFAGALLFGSATIGLTSAFVFLFMYNGGLAGTQLITIAYPFPFGKIFLIVFAACAANALTRGGRGYMLAAAIAAFAAAGTHVNHFLIIAFITFAFSLAALAFCKGEERRRLLRRAIPTLALSIILVNLPYLILRYMRDYAPNNEIQTHVQGTFQLARGLTIINPVVFFSIAGSLSFVSLLAVFILWRRSREDLNLRLLLCGVIGIYAVVFNPLLVPLIAGKISYLLLRFEFAIPSALVAAYLLDALVKKARGGVAALSRSAAALGWIAFGAAIMYAAATTVTGFAYGDAALAEARKTSCLSISGLYDAINRNVPPGSVIASDPVTSYCIPAFTDQFVICTFDQHSIPNDSTALERILACRDIYLPSVDLESVSGMLRRYGAQYVALNGTLPRDIPALYWKPDREFAEAAFVRLSSAPACFDLLYREGDVSLFRFIDSPGGFPAPVVHGSADSPGTLLTSDDAAILTPSGEPGIRIRDLRAYRARVQRGDTLRIAIDWVAERRCEPRSYVAHIRFDAGLGGAPLYRPSYGKPYRKAYEFVHGRRYRFSTSHLPLGGVYPPDKWEPLRVIADTVDVLIPRDVSPGVYTISIKMSRQSQYPNYTLRDLLSDKDIYQGAPLGEIEIE